MVRQCKFIEKLGRCMYSRDLPTKLNGDESQLHAFLSISLLFLGLKVWVGHKASGASNCVTSMVSSSFCSLDRKSQLTIKALLASNDLASKMCTMKICYLVHKLLMDILREAGTVNLLFLKSSI
jgi:hypothetical protein